MTDEAKAFLEVAESSRQELLSVTVGLSDTQRAFKPAQDAWSILEVLQHLILVEEGILRQIGRPDVLLKKPVFPIFLGRMIYWAVFGLGIRARAPVKSVLPKEVLTLEQIRERWDEKRRTLRTFLETIMEEDLSRKIFFHPILGVISVRECMDFLQTHFDHHLKQVRRIRASGNFPR